MQLLTLSLLWIFAGILTFIIQTAGYRHFIGKVQEYQIEMFVVAAILWPASWVCVACLILLPIAKFLNVIAGKYLKFLNTKLPTRK